MKWISVKDRLPEQNEITDVYIDLGRRIPNYKWDHFDLTSSFMPHTITHWMPLPEPPK